MMSKTKEEAEEMLDRFYPEQETFTKKEVIIMLDSLFAGFAKGASEVINEKLGKEK